MSRFEKNFDTFDQFADYYHKAAGMEFYATWGNLPLFQGEIRHLEFMRVQTCWLESTYEDLTSRRRTVEALARSVLSPADYPDEEVKKWWSLFGVESLSPKLADAICTLYNDAPYREFSSDAGTQTAFAELYDLFEVNHVMKDAYRASLFTNLVCLIPDWETKKIRVLTPDFFRVVGESGSIEELWIARGYGGWSSKEFDVWSKDFIKLVDHNGNLKRKEENRFGRIPAVFLKLNRSNDLYGSGISEAAELSAWSNFIRLISTRVAVFQSYSVAMGTNLNLLAGTRIGPGFIIQANNPSGEPGSQPDFKYISPNPQFTQLEDYRQSVIANFERNQSLPGYLVDKAATPPSGIALQVAERQLNEKRKEHINALLKAEKDLNSLIAQQAKIFAQRDLNADSFGVQYADPETFNNAGDELDFDIIRMGQGLVSPSQLALKYFNQRLSDPDALALINKNKAFFPDAAKPEISVSKENV